MGESWDVSYRQFDTMSNKTGNFLEALEEDLFCKYREHREAFTERLARRSLWMKHARYKQEK